MVRSFPNPRLARVLLAAGLILLGNRCAPAQPVNFQATSSRFELSEAVELNRADSAVKPQLERVKAYLADRQWDEAVETLRQLMETAEDKLLGVTDRRYITLRDYVHLQLAALPPEALKLYRSRIDPVAQRWFQEGIARRDRNLLDNVVRQALASSFGDDALMALGEIALERGDYTSARWCWQRIVPADLPAEVPRTWPGFPDTDLELAAIRARLVLVSILEGSADRARAELAQFKRLHGDDSGRLGGREVHYAEALNTLLHESTTWPQPKLGRDWPTFAGNAARNRIAPKLLDAGAVAWRIPLQRITTKGRVLGMTSLPPPAVAEDANALLSYHPLLVGDLLLVNDREQIRAVRAATGKPAWGQADAVVYRAQLEGRVVPAEPPTTLGAPRFTMTAFDGKLYARMGSPLTSHPQREPAFVSPFAIGSARLVCLDLRAEGRLMWSITAEQGWAFEGPPLGDGKNVFVGMRRSDIRPQAHIACLDAQTGRRRWRRFICSAETPARGMLYECTHNLLTLQGDTLYYNTNLGAVAAVSARNGRIRWVSLYPRALRGDLVQLAPHWQRQLNPCVYDHGTLLVAPADSPRIFAFDAATGQMLWQTGDEVQDAIYLLGTSEEYLIAGGERLYWIGLKGEHKGRVRRLWPDGPEKPGHGRGLLAGDCVLWPTRRKIYVFDAKTARVTKTFDLAPRGVTGGNLLVTADGRLLIAGGSELVALNLHGGRQENRPETGEITWGLSRFSRGEIGTVPLAQFPPERSPGAFVAENPPQRSPGAFQQP